VDVNVRNHGASRYTIHVALDKGEVNNAFGRTYQQLSERGGIKGFRPGKVPRKILDRYYEEDVIRAFTYEDLVQDRLGKAMEEQELRPIDQLDIKHGAPPEDDDQLAETIKAGLVEKDEDEGDEDDVSDGETPADDAEGDAEGDADQSPEEALEEVLDDVPLREGEPFEFYVTFTAQPRPELPDLSGLTLKRPVSEVTDEEIDERIEELRQVNAEEVETDREQIAEGDLVVADLKIVLEDEDADEVDARQEEIVIGQRDYIGDIDEAMVGHEPGDIVEIEYTFDEDHPELSLAGRTARVIAEIDSFSARELPELSDEFAQSVGDYEGLDDLRGSIREQLQNAREEEAQRELRSQVLRHIVRNTQVELPEQFIEEATERGLEGRRQELQQAGMSVEEYLELRDLDEEQLQEDERRAAIESLKLQFALQALAQEREIEVSDADLTAELQRIAADAGGDLEFVQQAAMLQPNFMEDVRDRVVRRRLLEDIAASAEIEDVTAEEYAEYVAGLSEDDEAEVEVEVEVEVEEPSDETDAELSEVEGEAASNQDVEAAGDEDDQESEET
jgi:trigger factor